MTIYRALACHVSNLITRKFPQSSERAKNLLQVYARNKTDNPEFTRYSLVMITTTALGGIYGGAKSYRNLDCEMPLSGRVGKISGGVIGGSYLGIIGGIALANPSLGIRTLGMGTFYMLEKKYP